MAAKSANIEEKTYQPRWVEGTPARPGTNPREKLDLALKVEFYQNAMFDEPYVKISVPGDKTKLLDVQVSEKYIRRFPKEYDAFVMGMSQTQGDTPIEDLGWIDDGVRGIMKDAGVWSLEQLSAISDGNLHSFKFPDVRKYRDTAVKKLEEINIRRIATAT